MRPRAVALASFAIPILLWLYLGRLGSAPLADPDEGRYSEIPREMIATHDFVTPRLDGVVYFEKPPLGYWLGAVARSVFSNVELAGRITNAVLGLLTALVLYPLGRAVGGRGTGILAVVVLATSPLHLTLAHINCLDMVLTFFVTSALVCFWLTRDASPARARLLWHGVAVNMALAVLTKGLIGAIIPGAAILFPLAFTESRRSLRGVPWLSGTLVFAAIAVPWHVLVEWRNPGFLYIYFIREHLLRYATDVAHREQPFWFFVPGVIAGFFPWTLTLIAVPQLHRVWRSRGDGSSDAIVFLGTWAAFIFLFFSASRSKLMTYILPMIPPLAVLAACALDEARRRTERIGERLRWSGILAGAGCFGVAMLLLAAAAGRVRDVLDPASILGELVALGITGAALGLASSWLWHRRKIVAAITSLALSIAAFFSGVWFAAPQLTRARSARDIARELRVRMRPGDEVYAYGSWPPSLSLYLDRWVGAVAYEGEMDYGIGLLPERERRERFPSPDEFRPIWESDRTIYLVADGSTLRSMARARLTPGHVLGSEGGLLLLTNAMPAREEASTDARSTSARLALTARVGRAATSDSR